MDKARVFRHEKADGDADYNWVGTGQLGRRESLIMSKLSGHFLKSFMRVARFGFGRPIAIGC